MKTPSNEPHNLALWKEERLFYDSDTFFTALCQDFDNASESILLETYIFQHDELGKRIVKHLIAAAKRDVEVKIIVDGFGSPLWKYFFQAQMEKAGIECKVFHRIPLDLFLFFPMLLPGFRKLSAKLDRRNHRKLYVIDNKIAFLGSMNIVSYHLKEFRGKHAWRDTGVRVTGSAVVTLSEAFKHSWESPHFLKKNLNFVTPLVRTYNSRRRQKFLYKDFLSKLENAQEKIWLTTAYFVPPGSFLKKLRIAAKKNVNICILTTAKTDVFLIRWVRTAFYFGLLKSGAKIFEYQPTVLHAKCAIIDDFVMLGSTNLNNRSFFHNLEIDVVLKSKESLQSLENQFQIDLSNSHEILAKDWKKRFWLDRFLGKIAILFKYWL